MFKLLTTVLVLTSAQKEKFGLAELEALFKKSGQSIEKTVEALPAGFKQNVVIMFRSESIQSGSCENPRLIAFDETSGLRLSIGGSEKLDGFQAIEAAEFDSKDWKTTYQEFYSPQAAERRNAFLRSQGEIESNLVVPHAAREGKNPITCMACHSPGNLHSGDPRGVGRPYPRWAGALGSFDDFVPLKMQVKGVHDRPDDPPPFDDTTPHSQIFDPDFQDNPDFYSRAGTTSFVAQNYASRTQTPSLECIEKFRSTWDKHPRYKHFTGIDKIFTPIPQNPNIGFAMNMKFTALLYRQAGLRIARRIAEHKDAEVLSRDWIARAFANECEIVRPQGDRLENALGDSRFLFPISPSRNQRLSDDSGLSDGINVSAVDDWALWGLLQKKANLQNMIDVQLRAEGVSGGRPRIPLVLERKIVNRKKLCDFLKSHDQLALPRSAPSASR